MKNKIKADWRIVCVALVCLTILEIYALSQGINGTLLTIVIAIIAGAAGYIMPSPIQTK